MKCKVIKLFVLFSFLAMLTIPGNAQNTKGKIDFNDERAKKITERAKERRKGIIEQLSPYNKDNINVVMNPMMPYSRDVSQYKVLDKGCIRILYAFNAADITKPATYDDLQRLEIGEKYVKYYSGYAYQGDSIATKGLIELNEIYHSNFKLEGGNIVVVKEMRGKHQGWSQYLFSEYFKDLTKNEMTEYCLMPAHLGKYNSYYTEPIPTQEWKIIEETIEIAGYQCQKATCNFRGRDYTAWFTVDIPVNHGPWKFGGLPGLIMKVYDDKQEYVFECVGIEQYPKYYPIILLDNYNAYNKTTRPKLDKLLKAACENYYQLSGLTNTASKLLRPYNPMELK